MEQKMFFLVLFIIFLCYAQDINISGIVKDSGGKGIEGANVLLKGVNTFVLTGADGSFKLANSVGNQDQFKNNLQKSLKAKIKNGLMYLTLEKKSCFEITSYNVLGKIITSIKKTLNPGQNIIPILHQDQGDGVYLTKVQSKDGEFIIKGYSINIFSFGRDVSFGVSENILIANKPSKQAGFKDTLQVAKIGYVNKLIPLKSSDTSNIEITLDKHAIYGRLGTQPEDFKNHGIKEGLPEPWEDGRRQEYQTAGEFEWWYADAKFSNGMILVLNFHVSSRGQGNVSPSVSLDISDENQVYVDESFNYQSDEFSAKKESTDVKMASNFFKSIKGLDAYEIFIDPKITNEFGVKLHLEKTVPSYRPGTGFWESNDQNDERYFAWLCAVPGGKMKGTLIIDNKEYDVEGSGYHDHNWGNTSMSTLLGNWYWGRGDVKGKVVVMASVRFNRNFASVETPLLYIADSKNILVDALNEEIIFQADNNSQLPICKLETRNNTGAAKVLFSAIDHLLNGPTYKRYRSTTALDIKINGHDFQGENESILEYMYLRP